MCACAVEGTTAPGLSREGLAAAGALESAAAAVGAAQESGALGQSAGPEPEGGGLVRASRDVSLHKAASFCGREGLYVTASCLQTVASVSEG